MPIRLPHRRRPSAAPFTYRYGGGRRRFGWTLVPAALVVAALIAFRDAMEWLLHGAHIGSFRWPLKVAERISRRRARGRERALGEADTIPSPPRQAWPPRD
jgi:hypothetical protein